MFFKDVAQQGFPLASCLDTMSIWSLSSRGGSSKEVAKVPSINMLEFLYWR